jgi:hypothetical protein
MIPDANNNDHAGETLTGRQYDWSTLIALARRVIQTASLAVMAHAEAETVSPRDPKGKDA